MAFIDQFLKKPTKADRISELEERVRVLTMYHDQKRAECDWHGVRDAAADIEVVAARIDELRRV